MKKIIRSAVSLLISLSLASCQGASLMAQAASEGTPADSSELTITFGELGQKIDPSLERPSILSNYGEGTYNLGDYLDPNNTAVYKALQSLKEPSTDIIYVTLPEPMKVTVKNKNTSDPAFFDAIFSACSSGMDAFSYDTPEVFWMDEARTSVGVKNLTYVKNLFSWDYTYTIGILAIAPAYYESFSSMDEILEYKSLLEDTVENFTVTGDTRYKQLKSIHDQIALSTVYDLKAPFSGSALGSLLPGENAVCEGYAKGFKLICDKLGIPCTCIFGNYEEETSSGHMWNYVLMEDGYWYAVDVTWDDFDGDYGIEIIYDFFLKGSRDFNVEHFPTEEYILTRLKYPEIAEWNYGEPHAVVTTTSSTVTTTSTTSTVTTTITKTTTVKPTTTSTTKTTSSTTKKTTTTTAKKTTTTTKATTTSATTTAMTSTPIATTTVTTTAPEPIYGDLNRDGKVSVADLVYCASHVLAIEKAEYPCDLNSDGRTDAFDVTIMRKILIENISRTFRLYK